MSWAEGVDGLLTAANRKGRGLDSDGGCAGSELKNETPPSTTGF